MSYLKIFPKLICTKRNAVGNYVGILTYDFEQYGRMLYGYDSGVALICVGHPSASWMITSTDLRHSLSGFGVFIRAMNHYLFKLLRFDPVSHLKQVTNTEYEYYFDRVYFDMDTKTFNVIKEMSVSDAVENKQKLLRLKLRP